MNPDLGPWARRAACRDHPNPDLWFPTTADGEPGHSDPRPALAICDGCPVRIDCLEYALGNGEKFGIWGGTGERQRGRIRRYRRDKAA